MSSWISVIDGKPKHFDKHEVMVSSGKTSGTKNLANARYLSKVSTNIRVIVAAIYLKEQS